MWPPDFNLFFHVICHLVPRIFLSSHCCFRYIFMWKSKYSWDFTTFRFSITCLVAMSHIINYTKQKAWRMLLSKRQSISLNALFISSTMLYFHSFISLPPENVHIIILDNELMMANPIIDIYTTFVHKFHAYIEQSVILWGREWERNKRAASHIQFPININVCHCTMLERPLI